MNFLKKRMQAFACAFSGLLEALKNETHLKIHLLATLVTIATATYYSVTRTEWILLSLVFALVLALELLNSAVERLCNKLIPDINADVKYIKDVAAAAVLIAAMAAVVTGLIIFWPYVLGS